MEQTIDVPGYLGRGDRISELVVEQINVLGSSVRAISCAAASTLEAAESPNQGFFATFLRGTKSEVWAAIECEPAVALELVHLAGP